MILPPDLAAALGQLRFAGLGRRHSPYGEPLAEIARLTAPNSAGGVAATVAHVEQLGPGPSRPSAHEARGLQQRAPQLVPIEVPVFESGPLRICRIAGWTRI